MWMAAGLSASRIEVQQQGVWTRGDVSEDEGPQAKTIKLLSRLTSLRIGQQVLLFH